LNRILIACLTLTAAATGVALLAQTPAAPQRGGGFALGASMPPGGAAPQ